MLFSHKVVIRCLVGMGDEERTTTSVRGGVNETGGGVEVESRCLLLLSRSSSCSSSCRETESLPVAILKYLYRYLVTNTEAMIVREPMTMWIQSGVSPDEGALTLFMREPM